MEDQNEEENHSTRNKPDYLPSIEDSDLSRELLNMCIMAVTSTSSTAAVWMQLTMAGIALHTSQLQSSPGSRATARRAAIINITQSERQCRDLLRLSPIAFESLLSEIKCKTKVKNYTRSSIEEQLVTFLLVLGHNMKNRVVSVFLSRSGETVSRHFHNILEAIIALEEWYIKPPSVEVVQPTILESNRFFPYFKDCLGAIDGTHVRVKVSQVDAHRYRGRKGWPTQNVLAACTFDLKFTYVLAGWEGSAADSRILQNALTRDEPLVIPDGKFYLGDSGFGLTNKLLTPYGRTRYHLKEFSQRGPETREELFNHRHSSLRNAIERAFGVLKKRFPIMASGSECQYSCATMTTIILACCVLHNFITTIDSEEWVGHGEDNDAAERDADHPQSRHAESHFQNTTSEHKLGQELRDLIAASMWADYCTQHEIDQEGCCMSCRSPMSTPSRANTTDVESTDRSPKNFRWANHYEETLIDLLLREERKGNRPDGNFTASAFRNVVKDFNKIHGTHILKKHVKSRMKTMKQHFMLFHGAFNGLSGFAWNQDTKMFEADDDLWDERTKENPKLERLRDKSCPNWDKLYELYGGTRANGDGAVSAKEKNKRLNRVLDFEELRLETESSIGAASPAVQESSYGEADFNKMDTAPDSTPDFNTAQQTAGSSRAKLKRKATLISVMEEGYKTMAASIEKLSVALSATGEKVAGGKVDVQLNLKIYETLAGLGLNENYRLRCYFYLCENPAKAAILVAAPAEVRGKLLNDIMQAYTLSPDI